MRLEDFDDTQVSEFLSKWHDEAEDHAEERKRLVGQLERALRDSRAVRELAGNPLLLTMMAILNRSQELPRDRVELYSQASRVLLHDWDASRYLADNFARQEKEELLRELAGIMQQGESGLAGNLIDRARLVEIFRTFLGNLGVSDPYGTATSLVKQLTERNFILCFAGADHFSFVHRTFLEYFCASWFVDLFQKKQTLTFDQLKHDVFGAHWKDETWHEVLRLIAGMVGEKQAEELILFLMEQDGAHEKLANLMLAAGCLSEVRNRPAIQKTGEALRRKFIEHVIRYAPPYYLDQREMDAEAAPTRKKAVGLIAQVWRSENTRAWLSSAALADNDGTVRMAAVEELARVWKDHPETLSILRDRARDEDNAVRTAAIQELLRGWNDHAETLAILKERALDERGGSFAIRELARHWRNDADTLPILERCARSAKDFNGRTAALQELARGWKDDPETLSFLKDCVRSDKQWPAIKELVLGWKEHPETLTWLKERVRSDEAAEVRGAALQELARGWKDDPDTLPLLKELARSDKDDTARAGAVLELARGWKDDPDTLPLLKELARSEHHGARIGAFQELARGWKDDPDTLPLLKELARSDENWQVRQGVVIVLGRGWKDQPEALRILKDRAQSDEHYQVRRWAALGLVRDWKEDPETLPIVKELVRSKMDWFLRKTMIEELVRGWKDDPETPRVLKERARYDESIHVRRTARLELVRGWKDDPEAIRLLHLLKED
jgi:predicted NACHT family NTPase